MVEEQSMEDTIKTSSPSIGISACQMGIRGVGDLAADIYSYLLLTAHTNKHSSSSTLH